MKNSFKTLIPKFLPIVLLLAFAFVIYLTNRPSNKLLEFRPTLTPSKYLVNFAFGNKLALADALWIRVLQADDFCENPNEKAAFNPGLSIEEALTAELKPSRCHLGSVNGLNE